MKLQLLRHITGYINGQWTAAQTGATTPVIDPATGEELGRVPTMGSDEATRAVEAGERAMRAPTSLETRRAWLRGIADQIETNKSELARIITLENGKPLREAVAEAEYAAGFFAYFARQIGALCERELPERPRGCRWVVHHRPAGVAGLITPWNFPLAMLAKKLAAALAAGCAVVAKPAPKTPLSAIALWSIMEPIGVPPGYANLVIGDAAAIGRVLCEHPAVRVLSFTGSTAVGKTLATQCARHVKRLALELGGNAPFIVFDDADPDAAATALIANKFRAGGQTCVCANRVLVQRGIMDRFVERLTPKIAALRVGNGLDGTTDIGPLINRAGFEKVARHVDDAITRGAQRIVGHAPSTPRHDWGCFFPPTLLTGIRESMLLCEEETFGPVVAVAAFDDEADAITRANATPYGLAAYVFTTSAERSARVIEQLRFGHVGVNTGTGPTPEAPFGGMKQSGLGREGGVEGMLEFCEIQTTAMALP